MKLPGIIGVVAIALHISAISLAADSRLPTDAQGQAKIVSHEKGGKFDGFKIFNIKSGSLYQKAGLKNGDVLLEINGEKLSAVDQVLEAYNKHRLSGKLLFTIRRRGKIYQVSYKLEPSKREFTLTRKENGQKTKKEARIVPEFKNKEIIGYKLLRIRAKSSYARLGLKNGDVITHLNDQPINDMRVVEVFYQLINQRQLKSFTLKYTRHGKPLSIKAQVQTDGSFKRLKL